ncbi:hypothetical protein PSPO01_13830 [Paraphaeosphaeria sporulosa]
MSRLAGVLLEWHRAKKSCTVRPQQADTACERDAASHRKACLARRPGAMVVDRQPQTVHGPANISVLILLCFRPHRAPRAASRCVLTATIAHFDSEAPGTGSALSARNCYDAQRAELRAENTAGCAISNWPRGAEAGTLVHCPRLTIRWRCFACVLQSKLSPDPRSLRHALHHLRGPAPKALVLARLSLIPPCLSSSPPPLSTPGAGRVLLASTTLFSPDSLLAILLSFSSLFFFWCRCSCLAI